MKQTVEHARRPRITPDLDPAFQPAALVEPFISGGGLVAGVPVSIALEQADGSIFHREALLSAAESPVEQFRRLERLAKFLLWSRGGWRIYLKGPRALGDLLIRHYQESPTGRFDTAIIGEKIFGRSIEVVVTDQLPPEQSATRPLGRHLDGCRIGFDLGGSDRKVAAVRDGQVVFSEETVWDPYFQSDPQYHFDGIMDSLRKAASHLPRVDAIGGSAAGVYVNNRPRVASLFRGVPEPLFDTRVRDIFFEVKRAMGNVPLEVVNDGEVTALAGSMNLGRNAVLGLALGTSLAAGYVTREGNITSWLNELAFAPVDLRPDAPRDEWSGDAGVGAQYFSQQAVGRLMRPAGIETEEKLPLPEKLKIVQALMAAGDERARRIYRTIGTCLGFAIAQYASFYDFDHLLLLGRVTSGEGGEIIVTGAREVLAVEFPELHHRIQIHLPGEKEKRHGQAVAAASLPRIG